MFGMGTGVTSLPSSLHFDMDVMASTLPQDVALLVDVPFKEHHVFVKRLLSQNWINFHRI